MTVSPLPRSTRVFDSFWLAGFESACQINRLGERVDMIAGTQHDVQATGDYARLARFGIRSARDGVRWPLIERTPGRYDFASFAPMVRAARDAGVQVAWNLCHYGWPDDLDPFHPDFAARFARFAEAVARCVASDDDRVPVYTPVNEISFLTYAAGDAGFIHPFAKGRGPELKRRLVAAAIAAMAAVRSVDPRARFLHVDPVINIVPQRGRPEQAGAAAESTASQWEAWDMLAGRLDADLGGRPGYLDIVGVNFYHANQWEHEAERLRWEDDPRDERWKPFHAFLGDVWARYGRPLCVAETSHFGVGRAPWLREIADEVISALRAGIPLEGVCLYPILDRYDWENADHWHNSGLWDLFRAPDGTLVRVVNDVYAAELRRSQARVADVLAEVGHPHAAPAALPVR